jgi:hypothetical protein
LRPRKVWKHLYDVREGWERITGADVTAMRRAGEDATGLRRANHRELPDDLDALCKKAFRRVASGHHDGPYLTAYWRGIEDPATRWTPVPDKIFRHHGLSKLSVFLVVELGDPSCVVTAYRPHPKRKGVMSEEELLDHGLKHFFRSTGVNLEDLAQRVAQELGAATATAPTTVSGLWALAAAVGTGRLILDHPDVAAVMPRAEAVLVAVGSDLHTALVRLLDWEAAVEELADGVQDDRPEDLEAALISSEELLAVANAIGEDARALQFLEDVEGILAWIPPEWSHLLAEASARCAMFEASEKPAAHLWSLVEASVVGATVRESAPNLRPEARLVSELLGQESGVVRLLDRIQDLGRRIAPEVRRALENLLTCFTVEEYEPILSAVGEDVEDFDVRYPERPEDKYTRLFVVDALHPEGEDLTDKWQPQEVAWGFSEADGDTVLVLFSSERPIPPATLATLLDMAEHDGEIAAAAQQLTPPT